MGMGQELHMPSYNQGRRDEEARVIDTVKVLKLTTREDETALNTLVRRIKFLEGEAELLRKAVDLAEDSARDTRKILQTARVHSKLYDEEG